MQYLIVINSVNCNNMFSIFLLFIHRTIMSALFSGLNYVQLSHSFKPLSFISVQVWPYKSNSLWLLYPFHWFSRHRKWQKYSYFPVSFKYSWHMMSLTNSLLLNRPYGIMLYFHLCKWLPLMSNTNGTKTTSSNRLQTQICLNLCVYPERYCLLNVHWYW